MKRSSKCVLAATVLGLNSLVALDAWAQETCADALAAAPDELVLVREIYGYLNRLDAAHCPQDVAGALDELIDTRVLNMVSFAMLEARLGRSDLAIAEAMLTEALDTIETANAGLDASAVLMLVDIAYRPCDGDEHCVGEKISEWIGDRVLTGNAACTFGLEMACNTADGVPFLNTATLEELAVPDLRKARSAFVCMRYGDCERGAF